MKKISQISNSIQEYLKCEDCDFTADKASFNEVEGEIQCPLCESTRISIVNKHH